MGASPVTPQKNNLDGHIVPAVVAVESTGATTVETVNLGTYDYKIDIRDAHPILNMIFFSSETNATGTEPFTPDNEMPRGTAPDSIGEWQITDIDTVTIYKTADQNGLLLLNYKAFGVQLA